MIYFFDPWLAKIVGDRESILLINIAQWVSKNEQNEQNLRDGCYWTYNSIKAYCKQFPCWSKGIIDRTLKSLEKGGYIKARDDLNVTPYDHTKWYTLTQEGSKLTGKFRSDTFDFSNLGNQIPTDEKSTIKQKNNHKKNTERVNSQICESDFNTFWDAYPKKVGKPAAKKAFSKQKPSPDLLNAMLNALSWQKSSNEWRKDDGQYIPNPATWLNQERWTDSKSSYHFGEIVKKDVPPLTEYGSWDEGGFI